MRGKVRLGAMVGGGYGMVTQMRLTIQASAVAGRIAGRTEKTRRDRQTNAHHISYQQAAVASNAVQVTAHGASPGDTTSQLLAGDEAPPLSEEGTVALRCTGNTPFGNL